MKSEFCKDGFAPPAVDAIRLIATDLDGTLLRPDGSISQYTLSELRRAQEAGMLVVLVSARPPRVMRQLVQSSGLGGLAICCNGALLYDLDQDCILQSISLQPEQITWLINTMRVALPELSFAIEDGLAVICEPGYAAYYGDDDRLELRIASTITSYSSPAVKLMARHTGQTPGELHEQVLALVGAEYSVTYSGGSFLEIAAAGINKAAALERFCAQRGISAREVIAFGDMPNDLPMLQWAGRSVAVANAHPLVLAAVHEITRSNAEDGVALVLQNLIVSNPSGVPH